MNSDNKVFKGINSDKICSNASKLKQNRFKKADLEKMLIDSDIMGPDTYSLKAAKELTYKKACKELANKGILEEIKLSDINKQTQENCLDKTHKQLVELAKLHNVKYKGTKKRNLF